MSEEKINEYIEDHLVNPDLVFNEEEFDKIIKENIDGSKKETI